MSDRAAMFRLLAMLPEATRLRMARMYADSLVQLGAQLGEAVARGDALATRTCAHKLAGAAAMMQDEALSTPTRRMEQLLLEGEIAGAYALWPGARAAADASVAALATAYPQTP